MSFQAMARVIRYKATNSTQKLLLLLIANYADEDGVCYPSQGRLAEDGSMSIDSVGRGLKDLEAAGAIIRQRRSREDGSRSSDQITIVASVQSGKVQGSDNSPSPQIAENKAEPNPLIARGGSPLVAVAEPISLEPINVVSSADEGEALTLRLWELIPESFRKNQVRTVTAVSQKLKAGSDPEAIIAGTVRYYDVKNNLGEADQAKAPNEVVGLGLFEKFLPRDFAKARAAAEPEAALIGDSLEAPDADRQRSWMRRYTDTEPRLRADFWPDKYGPPPGAPGCRVSAAIQREFGVRPFEDLNRGGDDDGTD